MKIILLIVFCSIAALAADIYIYRRIIRRHNFAKVLRIGYIVYSVAVDTMVVTALLAYNTVIDWQSSAVMRAIMWIIGIFFLNAVPKLVYALVSLADYPRQRRTGRLSHLFGYIGTALAIGCFLWLGYGLTYGRSVIRVERVELYFDDLPASFDGFRVAGFADTHLGNVVNSSKFLERLRDSVNMLRPDIVLNAGDIVNIHGRELDGQSLGIFAGMRPSYGVFSVLGNHDLGIYIRDTVKYPPHVSVEEVTRKQQELGWTVLRNASVPVTNGRDTIYIAGLDYPMDFSLNSHSSAMHGADVGSAYREIPEGAFTITISHAPQLWNEILESGVGNLTFAGHVHSMQIKLSVGKWRWSPAKFFYDRWSGLYGHNGRYLYINDGTGYVMFPMRIGTKPEVTLFVLRSGQKSQQP